MADETYETVFRLCLEVELDQLYAIAPAAGCRFVDHVAIRLALEGLTDEAAQLIRCHAETKDERGPERPDHIELSNILSDWHFDETDEEYEARAIKADEWSHEYVNGLIKELEGGGDEQD